MTYQLSLVPTCLALAATAALAGWAALSGREAFPSAGPRLAAPPEAHLSGSNSLLRDVDEANATILRELEASLEAHGLKPSEASPRDGAKYLAELDRKIAGGRAQFAAVESANRKALAAARAPMESALNLAASTLGRLRTKKEELAPLLAHLPDYESGKLPILGKDWDSGPAGIQFRWIAMDGALPGSGFWVATTETTLAQFGQLRAMAEDLFNEKLDDLKPWSPDNLRGQLKDLAARKARETIGPRQQAWDSQKAEFIRRAIALNKGSSTAADGAERQWALQKRRSIQSGCLLLCG
jgi:hypothetical protein